MGQLSVPGLTRTRLPAGLETQVFSELLPSHLSPLPPRSWRSQSSVRSDVMWEALGALRKVRNGGGWRAGKENPNSETCSFCGSGRCASFQRGECCCLGPQGSKCFEGWRSVRMAVTTRRRQGGSSNRDLLSPGAGAAGLLPPEASHLLALRGPLGFWSGCLCPPVM